MIEISFKKLLNKGKRLPITALGIWLFPALIIVIIGLLLIGLSVLIGSTLE